MCGGRGVVLDFTVLALLNSLQLQSIKERKLHPLVPERGFTVQEVMGKRFYGGTHTQAAGFWGLGAVGGMILVRGVLF